MPLIENPGNVLTATASDLLSPLNSFFQDTPSYRGPDFPDGFLIKELPEEGTGKEVKLAGTWMPFQPFNFGGEQRLAKEYYPGNPEPVVQVLGSKEDDVTIKGRFKAKKYRDKTLRSVPIQLHEEIDGIRQRGNLCKFALGEWVRYGFIESSRFGLKTLADIDWELKLSIVSDKKPTNCHIADDQVSVPVELNYSLIDAALKIEAKALYPPSTFPSTIFDLVSDAVETVASAIAGVTNFVDGLVSKAEDVQKLANTAIGLIKHARTQCVIFKKTIGALDAYFKTEATETNVRTLANEALKAAHGRYVYEVGSSTVQPPVNLSAAQIAATKSSKVGNYARTTSTQQRAEAQTSGKSVEQVLAEMLERFRAIAQTLPQKRHLVRSGDSLQRLSVKYYGSSQHWYRIFQHNQLQTTVLVPGTVLEIPYL